MVLARVGSLGSAVVVRKESSGKLRASKRTKSPPPPRTKSPSGPHRRARSPVRKCPPAPVVVPTKIAPPHSPKEPAVVPAVEPWIAEYVWLSGSTTRAIRSKYMTVTDLPLGQAHAGNLKEWNVDGSSTGQTPGTANSEIIVRPVAVFTHPFLSNAKVVLTECYYPDGTPHESNTRHASAAVFAKTPEDVPWFGLEQEYYLWKGSAPLDWNPPADGAEPDRDFYCSSGVQMVGRDIVMEHYELCLRMGLTVSGVNAEVSPGQWEFQVGPCVGIAAADHLVMARWLWAKLGEKHGVDINYDPLPRGGAWNNSSCHHNFSTKKMREEGGLKDIERACESLSESFLEDIKFYGLTNIRRMTGCSCTSRLCEFTVSVGGRNTSVRIGNEAKRLQKGYMEDRRPSSDVDPYLSTARLYASAMGYKYQDWKSARIPHQSWWDDIATEARENACGLSDSSNDGEQTCYM